MLLLKRPKAPKGFRDGVRAARRSVRNAIKSGLPLTQESFEALWTRPQWKRKLFLAQKKKCGYCEVSLVGQAGAIDHHFPKAEVNELGADPKTWGTERRGTTLVWGRKVMVNFKPGYWWMAYLWRNYVLACERCNTGWKRNFFPIQGGRKGAPQRGGVEVPLLLDPYGTINPTEHLRFGPKGEVEPLAKSEHGFETVRTCGLDCKSLRESRRERAEDAFPTVEDLVKLYNAWDEETASFEETRMLLRVVMDIENLGRRNRPHAGMVRAILTQQTPGGMTWNELLRLRGVLRDALNNVTSSAAP